MIIKIILLIIYTLTIYKIGEIRTLNKIMQSNISLYKKHDGKTISNVNELPEEIKKDVEKALKEMLEDLNGKDER